jgi:hypothetical protein
LLDFVWRLPPTEVGRGFWWIQRIGELLLIETLAAVFVERQVPAARAAFAGPRLLQPIGNPKSLLWARPLVMHGEIEVARAPL